MSWERRFLAKYEQFLSRRICEFVLGIAYLDRRFGIQFAVFGVEVLFKTCGSR